jgi:pyruvate ferredoxin oxidoreductase alpha subunit
MEIRCLLQEDLRSVLTVAQETEDAFAVVFGRGGNALLEPYLCDDAEYIVVGLGSLTYQLRDVVGVLRDEGLKVGVLGVRLYRPFPDEAIADALGSARGVIVIEKAVSYGYEGPLCSDIKAALYEHIADKSQAPSVKGLVAGIGGRDIRTADLTDNLRAAVTGALEERPDWIGLKL